MAAAGVLVSMFLTFSASSGVIFTMKALMVVVMGGVGNLLGCLVAGLALGLSEALVATFVDPGLTLAVWASLCQGARMEPKNKRAGGCFLMAAILVGFAVGLVTGNALRGVLIGLAAGIVIAVALWLSDRRQS